MLIEGWRDSLYQKKQNIKICCEKDKNVIFQNVWEHEWIGIFSGDDNKCKVNRHFSAPEILHKAILCKSLMKKSASSK